MQDFTTSDETIQNKIKDKVWQLVPEILNMANLRIGDKANSEKDQKNEYDYREKYWHICTALQTAKADPSYKNDWFNDATRYRKTGELLEVSFEPVCIYRTNVLDTTDEDTADEFSLADKHEHGKQADSESIILDGDTYHDPRDDKSETEKKLRQVRDKIANLERRITHTNKAIADLQVKLDSKKLTGKKAREAKETLAMKKGLIDGWQREKVAEEHTKETLEILLKDLQEADARPGVVMTPLAPVSQDTTNSSATPMVSHGKKNISVQNLGKQKREDTAPTFTEKKVKKTSATVLHTSLQEGVSGIMTNIRATLLEGKMDEGN